MIKNIKVSEKMKEIAKKVGVGILIVNLLFPLTGCQVVDTKESLKPNYEIVQQEKMKQVFMPYESIIAEPIESDATGNVHSWNYHPGYECIGITTSAYGKGSLFGNYYADGCVLYTNNVPVIITQGDDYQFNSFGEPVDEIQKPIVLDDESCVFYPGQHIISIPLNENEYKSYHYEAHEGYKPIGIAKSSYGKDIEFFAGAMILYTNTQTVKCEKDEYGFYRSFGTKYENEHSLSDMQEDNIEQTKTLVR